VRRTLYDQFGTFIDDLDMRDIRTISISAKELKQIPHWCKKFDLDFDDAYQYAIADRFRLKLVSLDHDFDIIPKGRIHPKNL
jgi:predicted nucleic acid-binding protein